MAETIVFLSCAITGAFQSAERRACIQTARRLLETIRAQTKGKIIPIAPYLLYAECAKDIVAIRASGAGWELNPPAELWLCGSEMCAGMYGDIEQAKQGDLPIGIYTNGGFRPLSLFRSPFSPLVHRLAV